MIVVARLSLVLLCVAVPLTVLAYFFGVVVAGVPYLARCIFELFVEITRQQTGRGYLWCHSSVCVKISRDKIFETCHTNKSKVSSSPSSPPPPSFRQVIDLALKALWLEM